MISVEEAQQIVIDQIPLGKKISLPLKEALGRVLAEEIYSPLDSPPFDASAMDGFALQHDQTLGASHAFPRSFKVTDLISCGHPPEKSLKAVESARIMTGGMIPQGATAVIRQEEVLQDSDGTISVTRSVQKGENIRRKGEEIQKGALAVEKNTLLTPGTIGFLASLGNSEIPVYQPPKIFIIPTGSELVGSLEELTAGKILESNSKSLWAALQPIHIQPTLSHPVPDIHKVLHAVIEVALTTHDMVVILGGVSVGLFDLAKEILEKLHVKSLFWQVSQKPGKPLFFGRQGPRFVFGLPGNPASSLTCFYEYVLPAIRKWMGYKNPFLKKEPARLSKPFLKKDPRTHFVRAIAENRENQLWVTPLTGQESHKMQAFAMANCFMIVPKEINELKTGEEVALHWLPQ